MEQSKKTMLDFAGFCFIHKPELVNEINTLIAEFINKPQEVTALPGISISKAKEYAEFCILCERKGLPLLELNDYLERFTLVTPKK